MRRQERFSDKTLITIGAVLILTSIIFMLFLFDGMGNVGTHIKLFFTGTFGLLIYGITFAALIGGGFMIFKMRIHASLRQYVTYFTLLFFLLLVFQTVSSQYYVQNGFGDYLGLCYYKGDTAGGVLLGILCYVPLKYFGYAASLSIFLVLLFVFAFLFTYLSIKNKSLDVSHMPMKKPKNATIIDLGRVNGAEEDQIVGKNLYMSNQSFKTKKESARPIKKQLIETNDVFSANEKTNEYHTDFSARNDAPQQSETKAKNNFSFSKDETIDLNKYDQDYLYTNNYRRKLIEESLNKPEGEEGDEEESKEFFSQNRFAEEETQTQSEWQSEKELPKENRLLDIFRKSSSKNGRKKASDDIPKINLPENIEDENEDDINEINENTFDTWEKEENNDTFRFEEEKEDDYQIPEIEDFEFNKIKSFDVGVKGSDEPYKSVIDFNENKKPKPESSPQKEKKKSLIAYNKPSEDILDEEKPVPSDAYEDATLALVAVLEELHIEGKVIGKVRGPAFTRYEVLINRLEDIRKISKTEAVTSIQMRLQVPSVSILAPIPGQNAVGIEIPNRIRETVNMRRLVTSKEFRSDKSVIAIALGLKMDGNFKISDLVDMKHTLVAGTTGSGKSSCINAMICGMLYKYSPDELKFVMVDMKKGIELRPYAQIPHLMTDDIITELKPAINAIEWLLNESERRFTMINNMRVKNLKEYNEKVKPEDKLPYIILIVDEFADLMLGARKEVENRIVSIAQKSRAAGIHMLLSTQKPVERVFSTIIKSNMPSRLAFMVTSKSDSQTILGEGRTEASDLLGKGDMIYMAENGRMTRLQGVYVTTDEIEAICMHVNQHNVYEKDEEIANAIIKGSSNSSGNDTPSGIDFLTENIHVVRYAVSVGQTSVSDLQSHFSMGYMKAKKIIDRMYEMGFIEGETGGSKKRKMILTPERFQEVFGEEL